MLYLPVSHVDIFIWYIVCIYTRSLEQVRSIYFLVAMRTEVFITRVDFLLDILFRTEIIFLISYGRLLESVTKSGAEISYDRWLMYYFILSNTPSIGEGEKESHPIKIILPMVEDDLCCGFLRIHEDGGVLLRMKKYEATSDSRKSQVGNEISIT